MRCSPSFAVTGAAALAAAGAGGGAVSPACSVCALWSTGSLLAPEQAAIDRAMKPETTELIIEVRMMFLFSLSSAPRLFPNLS